MWPETAYIIDVLRPKYALLENVPALLSSGYFGRILGDLAESGYDARWRILSAAEMGAPHKRDRVFIVCNTKHIGRDASEITKSLAQGNDSSATRKKQTGKPSGSNQQCEELADADEKRLPQPKHEPEEVRTSSRTSEWTRSACQGWWAVEPDVGRVANGVASRVDRLKALGNGQVPICAAAAFLLLAGNTQEDD